ncbi:MAG: helix-turn-helix domain-containing protein, partial [Candidatus Aminicenantes bacterium]|nr:helix-turn-helix domain-containing protein [Candidatus Aminicenantes bacterium]
MLPIGQDLKRERELRGISLKEIAESTKINIRFLRALEDDQFDALPGKFFTRGIIRGYAKYLGLEEE